MQRIVVGANPEAAQPWVADAAAQIAKQDEAAVAVVAMDELELEALATLPRSEYRRRAEAAAAAISERLIAAGVPTSTHVGPGPAVEGILRFADELGADLIVVGASTRGPIAERFLGSVPVDLIRRSRLPVLVVSSPGEHPG